MASLGTAGRRPRWASPAAGPGAGEAGAGGVGSPRARTQAVACLMVALVVSRAKEHYQKWPFRLAIRRYL